jgi:hypothetical protein
MGSHVLMDAESEMLGWLAALITPHDVAPHPNFWSRETPTPYGAIALLTSARFSDFARLREDERYAQCIASQDVDELLLATLDAIQVSTIETGGDRLSRLTGSTADLGICVAAAVLSAAAYRECDRYDDAEEVLDRARARLLNMVTRSPLTAAAEATLLLSQALTARDRGKDGASTARKALQLVTSVGRDDMPEIVVSRVRDQNPGLVAANVLEALAEAARGHVVQGWSDRLDEVKRGRSQVAARRWGQLAGALEDEIESAFRAFTSSTPAMTIGKSRKADRQLMAALAGSEYLGSLSAYHYRAMLGRLRLVDGVETSADWEVREGLRLLRQAGQSQDLRWACMLVVNEGPLVVLRDEAIHVVDRRLRLLGCTESDAVIVELGAPLLERVTASRAVDLLLKDRRSRPLRSRTGWENPVRRVEWIWKAIRGVAITADREGECFTALLDDLSAFSGEEINDYTFAGLLEAWETPFAGNDTLMRLAWEWTESEQSQELPYSRERLQTMLRRAKPPFVELPPPTPSTFQSIVTRVDDAILGVEEISADEARLIAPQLRAGMAGIRLSAADGAYSGGGVATAELAVAFMLKTKSEELWEPVLELLVDPMVQREDKSGAFERLASAASELPDTVRDRLSGKGAALLAGGPSWRDESLSPYPAALRFVGSLRLVSSGECLNLTARLMGQDTETAKAEAARTVLRFTTAEVCGDWTWTVALWMTSERSFRVRGPAAQALTIGLAHGFAPQEHISRVHELLQADGIYVPKAILVELKGTPAASLKQITALLETIASTHPHREVRALAQESLTGDENPPSPGGRRRWWR